MTVLKSKRKESQFEVFHHLTRLRRDITNLLLFDFGFDINKAIKELEKRFGGRSYEQLNDEEKEQYNKEFERLKAFAEWFIPLEREAIVNFLREINTNVYDANNLYPTCVSELEERRKHQDIAIGLCYALTQELQYVIESLPVNINKYTPFAEAIQKEINLIKGWRKSDNKFKKAISV